MTFVLFFNQPLHPRLVPLGPVLDPIHLLGLLAYTVSACSDMFSHNANYGTVITVLYGNP
jgi:hypothetical protein